MGRVACRGRGSASACAMSADSHARASWRFASWARNRRPVITGVACVVTRVSAMRTKRRRTSGASDGKRAASKRSCTGVATSFTF